jgi:hypothetical protein
LYQTTGSKALNARLFNPPGSGAIAHLGEAVFPRYTCSKYEYSLNIHFCHFSCSHRAWRSKHDFYSKNTADALKFEMSLKFVIPSRLATTNFQDQTRQLE